MRTRAYLSLWSCDLAGLMLFACSLERKRSSGGLQIGTCCAESGHILGQFFNLRQQTEGHQWLKSLTMIVARKCALGWGSVRPWGADSDAGRAAKADWSAGLCRASHAARRTSCVPALGISHP